MNCFYCKGDYSKSVTNHMVSLDSCIIIVKNVPCYTCEQCGESYFDDATATRLTSIVNNVKTFVSNIAVIEYDKIAS